jgi:hypothetical protein
MCGARAPVLLAHEAHGQIGIGWMLHDDVRGDQPHRFLIHDREGVNIERDQAIQTLAAHRADQPFAISIGFR